LTVEFTVAGSPCPGLNGGPTFKHTEAFLFQIDIAAIEAARRGRHGR
jgi:2-polyprenyl-6-hydroxyphenyl methylase/3-demethylubiquinone-9 3-methyltransferase